MHTPHGIKTTKQEHEFDILIYATGFDGVTGAYDRIDIRGENGLRLKDAWAETPRTYLGMLAEGFPNMLMVLGPHTARGNITQAISHSVEFQADMLRFMQQRNYTHVETRPEKVDEWTRIVIKAGEALLSFKIDSWQNGVNRNVAGRTVRRVLGYNGNGAHFRRTTDEVAPKAVTRNSRSVRAQQPICRINDRFRQRVRDGEYKRSPDDNTGRVAASGRLGQLRRNRHPATIG